MANFKRVEVKAYTKAEAIDQVKDTFFVQRDATQAWKKAGEPSPLDKEFKVFCADYLEKHTKNAPGIACMITYRAGSADTRERPYKMNDVVNEKGKRKYVTTYILKDKETGEELAKTTENKKKAQELAKKLYTDGGFRGSIICTYAKEVLEGEPVAFTTDYAPSKSAKEGHYIFFGVEKD
ncbi:hypothetical protein [Intestinibacter sp.]|uniref:hypothetical protein n=1 Tax=Intestinibacter sp. TaxID=1965304 RepID=UPI003F17C021